MKAISSMLIVVALACAPSGAGAGPGPGHVHGEETPYGRPGDPAKPERIVPIVMCESDGRMLFMPDVVKVRKGDQIRFRLRNAGTIDHEFVIGMVEENLRHQMEMEKNPDMEHDEPNARRLAPDSAGDVLWRFTRSGTFDFSCLIPGHRQAGMFGKIVVE